MPGYDDAVRAMSRIPNLFDRYAFEPWWPQTFLRETPELPGTERELLMQTRISFDVPLVAAEWDLNQRQLQEAVGKFTIWKRAEAEELRSILAGRSKTAFAITLELREAGWPRVKRGDVIRLGERNPSQWRGILRHYAQRPPQVEEIKNRVRLWYRDRYPTSRRRPLRQTDNVNEEDARFRHQGGGYFELVGVEIPNIMHVAAIRRPGNNLLVVFGNPGRRTFTLNGVSVTLAQPPMAPADAPYEATLTDRQMTRLLGLKR